MLTADVASESAIPNGSEGGIYQSNPSLRSNHGLVKESLNLTPGRTCIVFHCRKYSRFGRQLLYPVAVQRCLRQGIQSRHAAKLCALQQQQHYSTHIAQQRRRPSNHVCKVDSAPVNDCISKTRQLSVTVVLMQDTKS